MNSVYLNGRLVPADQASVSVFDRGFLFADGVYEAIPVYQGQPLQFTAHLQRLAGSLAALNIPADTSEVTWRERLSQLQHSEGTAPFAVLYIQLTRGPQQPRQHLPPDDPRPTVMATLSALPLPELNPTMVKVLPLQDFRWHRNDIKSISLLGNIMLRQAAAEAGAAEPLLHREEIVTEGSACNFFLVKQGHLYTPPADQLILNGITRRHVLDLASQLNIPYQETLLTLTDFQTADECFFTSSTREIVPVRKIGSQTVGSGTIGNLTQQLIEAFHQSRPGSS